MPTTAAVAVESRNANHRTKHRKEVKRYHQRQLNRQLREEAKARDAQLFLFEGGAAAPAEAHADAAAGPLVGDPAADPGVTSTALTTVPELSGVPRPASSSSAQLAVVTQAAASAAVAASRAALTSSRLSPWAFEFLLRQAPLQDAAPLAPAGAEAGTGAGGAAAPDAATALAEGPTAGDAAATTTCRTLSVVEPATSSALVNAVQRGRAAPATAAAAAAAAAPVSARDAWVARTAKTPEPEPQPAHDASHHGARPSANSERIGVLPVYRGVGTTMPKLLNTTHVQRMHGVAPLPMLGPLAPGTDLNRPPRSYLTLDPVHNVHQHAPGFLRNQRVALQHMLASAVMEWKDMQQNALIVSSAEAMRTIFEQVYVPERPLALRVRRIGPTLVIDSRATEPTGVREMRQQALFGKALYVMKETQGRDPESAAAADAAAAEAAGQLALAVPERRLASVAASDVHYGADLHRFSQVLRWRMDTTEVLVGVDAPVVLDQRTNTEQLVRVKDAASSVLSADAEQRETLRSWFDAMMANVAQVGTYTHRDGVVQSHQVKKTTDMLGYVEARMAAAALSFTSSALQWLVKQCKRDGGTYALVRDYTSDFVELYEVHDLDESAAFVEETDKYFGCGPAAPTSAARAGGVGGAGGAAGVAPAERVEGEAYVEGEVPVSAYGGGGSHYAADTAPGGAPHLNRFNLNFGKTCFSIGQHIFRSGDVSRAGDALQLLHRSLRILLPCCREEPFARETVAELIKLTPALVARRLQYDTAQAVAASTAGNIGANPPAAAELFRDALLTCGRFEIPLRHMFAEAGAREGGQLLQAYYARCIVSCTAATCAVVALALESYYCSCHHLRVLRRARAEARAKDGAAAAAGHVEERDSVGGSVPAAVMAEAHDVLQVVVEGLVRLEEASELVGPLHSAAAAAVAAAAAACSVAVASTPVGKSASDEEGVSTSAATTSEQEGGADAATALTPGSAMSLMKRICSGPSRSGDVLVSGQPPQQLIPTVVSTSSATTAIAAGSPAEAEASCSTVLDPRTQVDVAPLRTALCELYGDVALVAMYDTVGGSAGGGTVRALTELGRRMEARLRQSGLPPPTTLAWLETLRADVVGLSFTALRFYGRLGGQSRRHLVKLALVYYLVGDEHRRTARYTKALEALHRSKSLLHASRRAAEDVVLGAVFGSPSMLQWADVMRMLGDVYRSVVDRKLEGAVGPAAMTLAQPLLMGPLRVLPEDADSFFTQALSAYTQGDADEGCLTAKAGTLLLYAAVLMERAAVAGVPASPAMAQRVTQLLREAAESAPAAFAAEREWQTLRLFTVSAAGTQDEELVRAVEGLLRRSMDTVAPVPAIPVLTTAGGDGGEQGVPPTAALAPRRTPVWADADLADAGGGHRRDRTASLPAPCPVMLDLQRALACCAMVEREAAAGPASPSGGGAVSEEQSRALRRHVALASAFLTAALDACAAHSGEFASGAATRLLWLPMLRSWREHSLAALVHRVACMVALRLLGAAQAQLAGAWQRDAQAAVKRIAEALNATTGAKASEAEAVLPLLRSLRQQLQPFAAW